MALPSCWPNWPVHLDPADKDKEYKVDGPAESLIGFDGQFISLHGTNAYRAINPPTDGKSGNYDMELDSGLTQTGTVLGPDGRPLPGVLMTGFTGFRSEPQTLETAAFTVHALDPRDPRELLFLQKERRLGGYLTLRGDEKIAPTVKLEPLGTLRGRVVDGEGQPIPRVRVGLDYAHKFMSRPVDWWGSRREPITTDTNGNFRIEYIIPGLELSMYATDKADFLALGDGRMSGISLRPGEDKNLGDIKAKRAQQ